MNYSRIYDQLINKRKTISLLKNKDKYIEKHHIIPRCMNGTNDFSNLIYLTPKEHYIAHLLLYKIYENTDYKYNLLKALLCMTEANKKHRKIFASSRTYQQLRLDYYKSDFSIKCAKKGHLKFLEKTTIEDRLNFIKITKEKYRKWREKLTSEEYQKIFGHLKTTFLGKHHSLETKQKMRNSHPDVSGRKNPQFGKCWICNDSTRESKTIKKEELESYISMGWRKGRFQPNYDV